ncbi:MAG: ABC transporter ATP-binding protein [Oscillospiraceae bacterium]|nr:ABC transporter ATP-binding protein [Oscillospiraceae bacterium]
MKLKKKEIKDPSKVMSFVKAEKPILALVAVSGTIFNAGMTAQPYFEGQLAQMLSDIIGGNKTASDMITLALIYVAVIVLVQAARFFKRLSVRIFANNVNRSMKRILFRTLTHKPVAEIAEESAGDVMTKAILDVDVCVEGIRKFTTEIFDTGVLLISYITTLVICDWKLALISLIFPPIAYILAAMMKVHVEKSAAAYKESAGMLNEATLDRVGNAITYRVFGQDENQNKLYENNLLDYEKKGIRSGLWETSLQPVYHIITLISVIFIIYFGAQNILSGEPNAWTIAEFTTFLSCFTKLAQKSSNTAKLFNAVQKMKVSWVRIKPLMKNIPHEEIPAPDAPRTLRVDDLSFVFSDGTELFNSVSFSAEPGEIIGVTGAVASGKSVFGRVFLCDNKYNGSIRFGDRELSELISERRQIVGYMGHDGELFQGTVGENILLGDEADANEFLKLVCMDSELTPDSAVGNGGTGLSGGQQQRLALARTLCHKRAVMVLDDPFSAVDKKTEREILDNIRKTASDSIIILISHRLSIFPELEQVLWIENGTITASTHDELMKSSEKYSELYMMQTAGGEEK